MVEVLGRYKNMCEMIERGRRGLVAAQPSRPFPGLHGKVKTSTISGTMAPIVFIRSPSLDQYKKNVNHNDSNKKLNII